MAVRARRAGGWVALVAFVASTLLPASFAFHAPDDTDAAWGAPGLLAGHSGTQFEPVRPAEPDRHCAICHWLRALEHSIGAAPVRRPHLALLRTTAPRLGGDIQPISASSSPARAPPALLG